MHRYDVVLMNPPLWFRQHCRQAGVRALAPAHEDGVCAALVERGLKLLRPGGPLGAIDSAMVETAAYASRNPRPLSNPLWKQVEIPDREHDPYFRIWQSIAITARLTQDYLGLLQ
ncbi:hypothetical protein [Hyalangium minutum]|uniref:hypothetical protein n=1 Tax=Hyalangium minutum TaxID=394096 RepID=UPI0012F92DF4|nr:hypothetical protein [Hyalangium minutum]